MLTSLIPNLSGKSEKGVLYKSLKITRGIEDNSARVWASIRVAEHLPSNLKEELLCEALQLARDIENDHIRVPLLKILGLSLATVSITDLYPLWKETLHILSARPRRFFLSDLDALIPIVNSLGGSGAIAETAASTQEIGKWWP